MNKLQQGSSIILVLVVMSILTLVCLTAYKSTLFFADFTRNTVSCQQQSILSKGLLDYGAQYARRHFDRLMAQPEPVELALQIDASKRGVVRLATEEERVTVQASLFDDRKFLCRLSCQVVRGADHKLATEGFQRHAIAL